MDLSRIYTDPECFIMTSLAIPLAAGSLYGIIAARKGQFDWWALAFSPIIAATLVWINAIIADRLVGSRPELIQSVAAATLLTPVICLTSAPLALAGCALSQLCRLRLNRPR